MKLGYAMVMAAGLAFGAGAAFAITPDAVVADLQAQGYTRVEVKIFANQLKVEAIRGTEKLEVTYDKASGAVLKSEVEPVDLFDNTRPGVEIRDRSGNNGQDSDDDDDSGNDDDDDDRSDDNSGSDDDDGDDDHGGNSGNDDDDDDNHGGNSGHGGGDDD